MAIFDLHIAISQKWCKIGHNYYETLIGTRICSISWCYFQWVEWS